MFTGFTLYKQRVIALFNKNHCHKNMEYAANGAIEH